jgi:hypothetical protein
MKWEITSKTPFTAVFSAHHCDAMKHHKAAITSSMVDKAAFLAGLLTTIFQQKPHCALSNMHFPAYRVRML